jgi:alkylhydroperoxidase/carboxymuconolactone decarboxylase family protein YurZ
MKKNNENCLNDSQKLLIAVGAAMGCGCCNCIESLHKMTSEQGTPEADLLKACQCGLDAKNEAIETMKAKVSELLKHTNATDLEDHWKDMQNLIALIRIAAFTAATSSPDVIKEVRKAFSQGVSKGDIKTCISIAKMIREKVVTLFDKEVAGQTSCCHPTN